MAKISDETCHKKSELLFALDLGANIPLELLEMRFHERESFLRQVIIGHNIPRSFRPVMSADDVLQQAWCRMCQYQDQLQYQGWPQLDRWIEKVVFTTMILMIESGNAKCRAQDKQVRAHSSSMLSRLLNLIEGQRSPSSLVANEEMKGWLRSALGKLHTKERIAIMADVHMDGDQNQIAHKMDWSFWSFKSMVYRARKKLRLMADEDGKK